MRSVSWMLLDAAAFRKVVGAPCKVPDQKCNRGRYKTLLLQALIDAGASPLLGGMEFAEDIVRELDIAAATRPDDALKQFVDDVNSYLRRWVDSER